jgi:gluconokinase
MSTAASPFRFESAPVLVVMGVSGCGKSTVAAALAARLGLPYLDGDDYHPAANVAKMSQGIPLTDADRWPWLDELGSAIKRAAVESGGAIATCSALKRAYRERLSQAIGLPLGYILLDGEREILLGRMQARKDHYMPPSLLDSQLEILERPDEDEPAITLAIDDSVEGIVAAALARLP